jgi:hypothetical protein
VIFHPSCIQTFLSRQKNQKCPSCKEKWNVPDGEGAAGGEDIAGD